MYCQVLLSLGLGVQNSGFGVGFGGGGGGGGGVQEGFVFNHSCCLDGSA